MAPVFDYIYRDGANGNWTQVAIPDPEPEEDEDISVGGNPGMNFPQI